MAEWIFDVLPPSGARRGGDPAEHAFARNLDTFVREVVQNANDQRVGGAAPEVHFQFSDLRGSQLQEFLEHLSWRTIEPHFRAAGATHGGRAVGRFLREMEHSGRLLLLTIEDRHTVGLTGEEAGEDSHFRALCKDTLYSHKRNEAAGGSYGLGKSVLWAFSGLQTVLFNSVLHEHPPGCKSPRLIGRAELPSHHVKRKGFTGSGWFGQPVDVAGGRRAESLWHLRAALEARDLFLAREENTSGTSIVLVGFRDPASDDEPVVPELNDRIGKAAVRWFWPAMEMATPGLRICAGALDARADTVKELKPFVECWRARTSRRATLEQPGDVVSRSIPIELPARRDGGPSVRAEVRLVVRLAGESEKGELLGHVALFPGAGMVIKYWDRSALSQGMRPFHALVAAGHGREPGTPSAEDRDVERFLRDAEPPGHDEWLPTPALKENWKAGYAKALAQLKDRIGKELRELLIPKPTHGARGPELLQKRFPIGARGSAAAEPSAFRFSDLQASFDGERWRFAGKVRPASRLDRSWQASITLQELGDSAAVVSSIAVSEVELETLRAQATIEAGAVQIAAPRGVESISFRGVTEAVEDTERPGELRLEVAGRVMGD